MTKRSVRFLSFGNSTENFALSTGYVKYKIYELCI